jgi:Arylsulfotransferase (ASST)
VWFKPLPTDTFATNLRVQEYLGKPALTWWQGDISVHGYGLGEDVIADQSYTDVAHVRAGKGLRADLHDFQLTPAGSALITAYDPIRCNLSSVGGPADGGVVDGLLQEIDVRTGLVMFQWSSLDHVALSESHSLARDSSTARPFDYFHINSIDVDRDGSLLISGRNTWAAYELDARSGQIVWRLGGKRSSFRMGPGTQTAWQHDPRQLADGSISIFDNGASPPAHGQSRGVVIALDTATDTATLRSQVVYPTGLLSDSQGDFQALTNGDWFVGWGQVPDFSEFSPSGALLLDAHFPAHTQSYRALRFAWTGVPSHPPMFALQPAAGDAGTVYASWNGATLVSGWRVLSGEASSGSRIVGQAASTGFETAIALPAGAVGRYMSVQALNAAGQVIGTAHAASRHRSTGG